MEINGNIQELYILKNNGGEKIRNCRTSGSSRVFCRVVAS